MFETLWTTYNYGCKIKRFRHFKITYWSLQKKLLVITTSIHSLWSFFFARTYPSLALTDPQKTVCRNCKYIQFCWHQRIPLVTSPWKSRDIFCYLDLISNSNLAALLSFRLYIRDHLRFFDPVGHQTINVSIGNKYFFTENSLERFGWRYF